MKKLKPVEDRKSFWKIKGKNSFFLVAKGLENKMKKAS